MASLLLNNRRVQSDLARLGKAGQEIDNALKECPLYPRKQTWTTCDPKVSPAFALSPRATERAEHPDAAWWRVAPNVGGSVAISAASSGLTLTPSIREQCKRILLRGAA